VGASVGPSVGPAEAAEALRARSVWIWRMAPTPRRLCAGTPRSSCESKLPPPECEITAMYNVVNEQLYLQYALGKDKLYSATAKE
jgi:hypothetical protein